MNGKASKRINAICLAIPEVQTQEPIKRRINPKHKLGVVVGHRAVNHKRRMKKIYSQYGPEAAINYAVNMAGANREEVQYAYNLRTFGGVSLTHIKKEIELLRVRNQVN